VKIREEATSIQEQEGSVSPSTLGLGSAKVHKQYYGANRGPFQPGKGEGRRLIPGNSSTSLKLWAFLLEENRSVLASGGRPTKKIPIKSGDLGEKRGDDAVFRQKAQRFLVEAIDLIDTKPAGEEHEWEETNRPIGKTD